MASHLDVSGDFHMGAIAALCDLASEKFRAVVQVRLEASGSTKQCVAIFDKKSSTRTTAWSTLFTSIRLPISESAKLPAAS